MTTPPESVQAAAQALAHKAAGDHFHPHDPDLDWQSWVPEATAALQAALPHLLPDVEEIATLVYQMQLRNAGCLEIADAIVALLKEGHPNE